MTLKKKPPAARCATLKAGYQTQLIEIGRRLAPGRASAGDLKLNSSVDTNKKSPGVYQGFCFFYRLCSVDRFKLKIQRKTSRRRIAF